MILRSDLDFGSLSIVAKSGFQYPEFLVAHDLSEVLFSLEEG